MAITLNANRYTLKRLAELMLVYQKKAIHLGSLCKSMLEEAWGNGDGV